MAETSEVTRCAILGRFGSSDRGKDPADGGRWVQVDCVRDSFAVLLSTTSTDGTPKKLVNTN